MADNKAKPVTVPESKPAEKSALETPMPKNAPKPQPPVDRQAAADDFGKYRNLMNANLGFADPDYRAVAKCCRRMAKLAFMLARRS